MKPSPVFARRVFLWASIYGLLVLLPQYLLETGLLPDAGPPLTRPEHFYGFIGVAVAWQLAFLVIASDVVRFRPLMLAAIVEKAAFGVPVLVLFAQGRVPGAVLGFGVLDLLLGALFFAAWLATPHPRSPAVPEGGAVPTPHGAGAP